MNRDLFLAILAMDSYNRDYGSGIQVSGSSIGNADIVSRASLGLDNQDYLNWQAAGFYAIAYDMTGVAGFTAGERVIAYRGTDCC